MSRFGTHDPVEVRDYSLAPQYLHEELHCGECCQYSAMRRGSYISRMAQSVNHCMNRGHWLVWRAGGRKRKPGLLGILGAACIFS